MWSKGGLTLSISALSLAACAQTGSPTLTAPPTAQYVPSAPVRLRELPGWDREDYTTALRTVRAACGVARDRAMAHVCAALPRRVTEKGARGFLEANFWAAPVGVAGRLTGYFMPIYQARLARGADFTAPVRPRPADLPAGDASAAGRSPYADRATIETRPAPDALAWMRPEDLFFMQIQGAGVLVFRDGERARAVFAGSNGAPFVGVATAMRAQGLLADQETSAEAIHAWLGAHRGTAADAIMSLDPRYVFYSLADDDGLDPAGSAGVRLPAGRAVAVDPAFHAMGELLWLDATAPGLAGAFPTYRRLSVALDTGGAIKGPARADLYLGRGPAAGAEAGRVRHALFLYRLIPRPVW